MKNKILSTLTAFSLLVAVASAQGTFTVGDGATVVVNSGATIIFKDVNVVNDGSITFNSSKAVMSGDASTSVSGDNSIAFYDLEVNKSDGDLQLEQPISVDNELTMTDGDLDLKGQVVTLSATAEVVSEAATKRLKSTEADAIVQVTKSLSSLADENVAGLGLILSTDDDLGSTTIRRKFDNISDLSNGSILRSYEVVPTTASNDIDAEIVYFDSELNSLDDTKLTISTQSGSSWTTQSSTLGSNSVQAFGLSSFDGITVTQGDLEVLLDAVVFLEGPYNSTTSLMNTGLSDVIPLEEPYLDLGFGVDNLWENSTPDGSSEETTQGVLDVTGDNAIVDWVFLELREDDSTTVVATRSALLQADGDVVDVDGTSKVIFSNVEADDYFVVVKHRNHLSVMSESTYAMSPIGTFVDFTDDDNVYSDPSIVNTPMTLLDMQLGKYGLYAGNANNDNSLTGADASLIFFNSSPIQSDVYLTFDVTFDSDLTGADASFSFFKSSPLKQAHIK